jgi:iron(III) transport system permease protein
MAVATSTPSSLWLNLRGAVRGWRNEALRSLIFLGTAVILGFFVLYPLGILFKRSLYDYSAQVWTFQNYIKFFSDPELFEAFSNTLLLALGTSVFSLLVALPMAWGVSRTDMPLRGFIRSMVVLTFATPSFLGAIGWIILLGPRAGRLNKLFMWVFSTDVPLFNIFSFAGMTFVLGLFVYPFLFFSVASALDNMDPSYEQSARILGSSNFRVMRTVTLPIVTPAILSGLILVILESFVVFGAPAIVGNPVHVHTLSTQVYTLFSDDPPQFHMAATAATPIVIVTAILLVFQRLYLGRKQYITVTGKSPQPQLVDIGKWKYVIGAYCIGIVFVSIILPMGALFESSILRTWGLPLAFDNISLQHYVHLFSTSDVVVRAFRNSFVLAVGAALVCIGFTFVMAWIVERTNVPGKEGLALLSMIGMAFPGVALPSLDDRDGFPWGRPRGGPGSCLRRRAAPALRDLVAILGGIFRKRSAHCFYVRSVLAQADSRGTGAELARPRGALGQDHERRHASAHEEGAPFGRDDHFLPQVP